MGLAGKISRGISRGSSSIRMLLYGLEAAAIAATMFFTFAVLMAPEWEVAPTGFQVSISLTFLFIALQLLTGKGRGGRKLKKGFRTMRLFIPAMGGMLLVGLGILAIIGDVTTSGAGGALGIPFLNIGSGALFLILGMEIGILSGIARMEYGARPTKLIAAFLTLLGLDPVIIYIAFPMMSGFVGGLGALANSFPAFLFLLAGKLILLMVVAMSGAKFNIGSTDAMNSIESYINGIFGGMVFFVIFLSVLFPAYYIITQTSGQEVSTLLNIQSPIIAEMFGQATQVTRNTSDFLMAMASAVLPEGMEAMVIDLQPIKVIGLTIWTTWFGLGLTGPGGEPLDPNHILLTLSVLLSMFVAMTATMGMRSVKFESKTVKRLKNWWYNHAQNWRKNRQKKKEEGGS